MKFKNFCFITFTLFCSSYFSYAHCAEIQTHNLSHSNSRYIQFSGSIEKGDFNKFKNTIKKIERDGIDVKLVVLDSIGGLVLEAYNISKFMRSMGMNTAVLSQGTCASSCFMIFMSGKERFADPNSVFMVHRASNLEREDSIEAKGLSVEINRIYRELNVPDNIRLAMLDTPPDKGFRLSKSDLEKISTKNNIQKVFVSIPSKEDFGSYESIQTHKISSDVKEGDIVTFGSFPFSDSTKFMPIHWKVAFKMQNQALLIANNGIDTIPFCKVSDRDCSWQKSYLREWLNGDFYKRSFSADEKKLILETAIDNARGIKKMPSTKDRIFVFSYEETSVYFTETKDFEAIATMYAAKKGATLKANNRISWWLRTSSDLNSNVYLVDELGKINQDVGYRNDITVRPALWIKFPD